MKVNFKKECILLTCFSVFSLAIVFINSYLKIIIGIPYILFIPGYLLTIVLFPKKNHLEGMTRAALSVGLSIITVPLIGLLLTFFSFGIRLLPVMSALTIFNVSLIIAGYFRRRLLPEKDRFEINLEIRLKKWTELGRVALIIRIFIIVFGFMISGALIYIAAAPQTGDSFTEFYILGQEGTAAGYQEQNNGTVKAVIINNEHKKTTYTIVIKLNEVVIKTLSPVSLEHLEKWEETISFEISENAAKAEFLLFKDGEDISPYRQLRLWIRNDIN